jgi:PKHD-type hydroxylase
MPIILPHILQPDGLAHIQQRLKAADWQDGRATAGDQAAQVKRNQQLAHDAPLAVELRALVLRGLDAQPLFLSAALPKRIYPPRFNRYAGQANAFGRHVDGAVRYAPVTRERVRTDLSCTVFLSDPASYDGGELVIHGAGTAPQAIKLPAGSAVLYPGTSVHEVTPVTRGERLAAFFWIESLVRLQEQRRLLFEMDMALMQLRNDSGESAAAVALTGCYHNLLRLWADT